MTFSILAIFDFKPAIIFIFRAKIAVIGRKFSNLIKKGHELCPSSVKNGQIPSKMVRFYEKWPPIICKNPKYEMILGLEKITIGYF